MTDEDIELIFAEVNKFMDKPITKDEILAVWSGIRPLVREMNVAQVWCFQSKNGTVDTKRISRSHEIWQKGDGFITIAGGKWTTVRNMAEDLCDSIERSTSLPVCLLILPFTFRSESVGPKTSSMSGRTSW